MLAKYKLLINGEWQEPTTGAYSNVTSPFSGETIAEVPVANAQDVEAALVAAQQGAKIWSRTPAHERFAILNRAADLADERAEAIAQIISSENGKPIGEARGEAGRAGAIIRLAAFEGTQLYGDSLPLDANPGTGQDKLGFTIRQPVGIVAAITPFNYPSLLVLHKVAPALASGNAVVLKPAGTTPLTALVLAEVFVDAGLPAGVLSVLIGSGREVGDVIIRDQRIRKISFTGSTGVGEHITQVAGLKRLSLELGASSPTLVLPGADIQKTAEAIAAGGYINAGQVCISVQRVIAHKDVQGDLLDALVPMVKAIKTGDPLKDDTKLGPLITLKEAQRVHSSIQQAVSEGCDLLTGGDIDGSFISPAIIAGVDTKQDIAQNELFGPAIAVSEVASLDEAIAAANGTKYGLAAGVFGGTLADGIRITREVHAGSIHLGWTPLWRADLMPYGGFKESGYGKEGIRAAIQEMTEVKTVILHS